jgi:putative CocE/NonD family hydrolase
VFCLTALSAAAAAAPQKLVFKDLHVPIPMRDGVRLYANIFLPSEHARVPAILVRTPYGKGEELVPNYQALVDHGFAMVVEDVRGRYESEGEFHPFDQEAPDGNDTLNWIARQSWCDGKIGMTGGSYLGIAQWKAALTANPHLKAIFPVVAGDDDYRDRFYSTGGAMKLGNRLEWMAENLGVFGYHPDFSNFVLHLPVRTADVAATGRTVDMFQTVVAHPAFDSFWKAISVREQLAKVRVPVFSVGGWYDNFAESDLDAYAALRKTSGLNRIVIGPWPHNMSTKFSGIDFGRDSRLAIRSLQIAWFDQWLLGKDSPLLSEPPARVFVMGTNRWREFQEWPPEQARREEFYLQDDAALGDKPPRRAAPDRYVYDPANPVPTRGGAVCCNPRVFPWGPMDQRSVEQRKDVPTYSTPPLARDLEVIGPVTVELYVSTTARDTDFTAKLVDVFPDGTARNLTDGILRLRYRTSLDRAALATPGQVYRITVDAGVTGNVFEKGHRIRLEISSSNFPRFDRNPNTGTAIATETHPIKATESIYHDKQHPSRLVLMVM